MQIDQKPRTYNYIQHKQNYPLQLTGRMKQRVRPRPQSSVDLNKNISNFSQIVNNKDLGEKIVQNYQNLKSVIPVEVENKHQRKHSIRTFNQQKYQNISGVALLMSKQQTQKNPQKRHLTDKKNLSELIDGNNNQQAKIHKQKRHYIKEQKQKQGKQLHYLPRKHTQTLMKKIDNDLYSQMQIKNNVMNGTVKMNKTSMFTQGIQLGYEKNKQHTMSGAKKREITGNLGKKQLQCTRKFRDDWRKTSFILG